MNSGQLTLTHVIKLVTVDWISDCFVYTVYSALWSDCEMEQNWQKSLKSIEKSFEVIRNRHYFQLFKLNLKLSVVIAWFKLLIKSVFCD